MTSEFRSTSPADAPAIAEFLNRVFHAAPGLPFTDPRHLYWKNWAPRPDWPGSRGYVLTRGDSIVAHATVVPLSLVYDQTLLSAVHLIDWASDPRSIGSGAALLKRIACLAGAIVAVGGSEMTEKVMPALGFRDCGTVTRFVRPIRPLRRLLAERLTPRAGARFLRAVAWNMQAPAGRVRGWHAVRVGHDDLDSAAIEWPRASDGIALFARTAETTRHLLDCPATPIEIYAVSQGSAARGHFILAFAPAQARIAGFSANSSDPEHWRIVLQLAVAEARRHPGIVEVISLGSDPLTRRALLDAGFQPRASSVLRVLPGKGMELPFCPIRFQMIDGDDAYLHSGRPDYWS